MYFPLDRLRVELDRFFVVLDYNFQTIITENTAQIFFDALCLLWRCFGYPEAVISVQVKIAYAAKVLFDFLEEIITSSPW